jgi:pyridoxine/pyridoxamine 5'-phosphate oxidase
MRYEKASPKRLAFFFATVVVFVVVVTSFRFWQGPTKRLHRLPPVQMDDVG